MVDAVIVKRNRTIESYSYDKLFSSLKATCLSLRTPEGAAETTAHHVCRAVEDWLARKMEVTSNDIRRKAHDHLLAYHPEAAYIYKQERTLA